MTVWSSGMRGLATPAQSNVAVDDDGAPVARRRRDEAARVGLEQQRLGSKRVAGAGGPVDADARSGARGEQRAVCDHPDVVGSRASAERSSMIQLGSVSSKTHSSIASAFADQTRSVRRPAQGASRSRVRSEDRATVTNSARSSCVLRVRQ